MQCSKLRRQFPAPHSTTSLAIAISDGGGWRPSALAVLRPSNDIGATLFVEKRKRKGEAAGGGNRGARRGAADDHQAQRRASVTARLSCSRKGNDRRNLQRRVNDPAVLRRAVHWLFEDAQPARLHFPGHARVDVLTLERLINLEHRQRPVHGISKFMWLVAFLFFATPTSSSWSSSSTARSPSSPRTRIVKRKAGDVGRSVGIAPPPASRAGEWQRIGPTGEVRGERRATARFDDA
jgi:hypothetical protein